jgi:hypothetical protein
MVPGLDQLQHQKSTRNALSGHSGSGVGSDSMNPLVTRNDSGHGHAESAGEITTTDTGAISLSGNGNGAASSSSSSSVNRNPPTIIPEDTARIYVPAPLPLPPPPPPDHTTDIQDYTSYPFRQVTPSASSSFSAQPQPQPQPQYQYQHHKQTSKRIIAEMPRSASRQPQLQPHTFPRPSYMNDLQAHQGTTTGSFPYELPSGSTSGRNGGGGTAIEVTINPAEEEEGHSHGTLVISKSGRSKYLGRTAASEWLKNVSLGRGK